jgi:tetratricopeptide (TPR) repeat protein
MKFEGLRELLCQFPDIDGFWNSDDLSENESAISRNIPLSDESPLTLAQLTALTQLVRVQGLQGRLEEAKVTLQRARTVTPDTDEFQEVKLRLLLEEGRLQSLLMSPTRARGLFQQAWELATQTGQVYHAIDSAFMLSISQPPRYPNEWHKRALEIAEKTTDENSKLWLSHLYLVEGWYAFDYRNYQVALTCFQKALNRPRINGETSKQVVSQWSIARTLRALGQVTEALAVQQALHAELFNQGRSEGHVDLEIAECLHLLGKLDEAKTYFESAYTKLATNSWYADNKVDELARMKYLYKKR